VPVCQLSEWTEADRAALCAFLQTSTGRKLVNNSYAQVLDVSLAVTRDDNHAYSNGYRGGMAAMARALVAAGTMKGDGEVKAINPDMGHTFESQDV